MLVVNYQQAEVQALVGGKAAGFAGFNRALDARRQIGSMIKPVIYLEALEQAGRFQLATLLQDQPLSLKSNNQNWQPQNFDQQFRGAVNLNRSLAESLNVPTVRLGLQLGLPKVQDGLRRLGLNRNVHLHPSSLLGALELSPWEVSQLYQTIANNGVYQPLATVQAVTDQDGYALHQRSSQRYVRYSPQAVYLLQHALIEAGLTGTARSLQQRFANQQLAGKTGTSSDYRDSWFSGFDQDSLLTVWLGQDDNQATGLTGGSGALRVFTDYFAEKGVHSIIRYMPEGISWQAFSRKTGLPVLDNCANPLLLPAISGEISALSACDD